jgi:hypothetical protein
LFPPCQKEVRGFGYFQENLGYPLGKTEKVRYNISGKNMPIGHGAEGGITEALIWQNLFINAFC